MKSRLLDVGSFYSSFDEFFFSLKGMFYSGAERNPHLCDSSLPSNASLLAALSSSRGSRKKLTPSSLLFSPPRKKNLVPYSLLQNYSFRKPKQHNRLQHK